jgi:hypothetical protein
MSDLRNQLDREANRISAKPSEALDGVLRRTERRHRRRQIVAGATALALVAAVSVGAWQILGDRSRPIPPGGSPTGSGKWPSQAWPHQTRAEAEQAQATVDSGNTELQWQTQAEQVAIRYGTGVLGWNEVGFDDSLDGASGDSVSLYAASCQIASGGAEPCDGSGTDHGDEEALITLEHLVRQGEGGVWTVTAVGGPNSLANIANFDFGRLPTGWNDQACPAEPVVPADEAAVRTATDDVLSGANGPDPAHPETVWKWLDPASHPAQGDPDLFAYHFRNTAVPDPFATWEIGYVGGDFPGDLMYAERCGPDISAGLTSVEVIFPGDVHVQMVWVTHPEGPRLYLVQQTG